MFRELRMPLAVLLLVLSIGVLGYRSMEGWSWVDAAWMALITITTIGYGEVHPLTGHERLFGMAYIVAAVGAGGFALAKITAYVLDGSLTEELRRQRKERIMRALRNHYIVVGFGRLGREVVEDLRHEGAAVVVLDPDERVFRDLPEGVHALTGDGSSDAVLRAAGIEHARAIAIATPSSAVNVFVTLSARQLNPKVYICTRVDEAEAEAKARRAGADALVSPFTSAGSRMAHRLLHPHAAQVVEQLLDRRFPDLVVDDVTIPRGSPLEGRLSELKLRDRHGVGLIAIRRADARLDTVPSSDAQLGPGDVAVVAGTAEAIRKLREFATPIGE